MKRRILNLLLVPLLLLPLAGRARAQEYRNDATWYAGGVLFGDLNAGHLATTKVKPETGWNVGITGQHWASSGRVGFRVNGSYTNRPVDFPDRTRNIGVTMADAGFVLRFLPATEGRSVAPYVGVGAGIVYYGFGAGPRMVFPEAGAVYEGDDHVNFAVAGSFGFDIRTNLKWDGNPVGFRLEAQDHWVPKSPLDPINGGDFNAVHNVQINLGVYSGFGIR
ncbi:MAG: hypothetical protein IRZ00_08415 [Gemmatimonadetes bacterium]|nr:hypothetical protein [Gemmatimonadota bacterium]